MLLSISKYFLLKSLYAFRFKKNWYLENPSPFPCSPKLKDQVTAFVHYHFFSCLPKRVEIRTCVIRVHTTTTYVFSTITLSITVAPLFFCPVSVLQEAAGGRAAAEDVLSSGHTKSLSGAVQSCELSCTQSWFPTSWRALHWQICEFPPHKDALIEPHPSPESLVLQKKKKHSSLI